MHPQLIPSVSKGLCVALFASGILFAPSALACGETPSVQATAYPTIDQIHLGMSGAEALQRLGTPESVERGGNRCGFSFVILFYPQFLVAIQVPREAIGLDAIDSAAQGVVIDLLISRPDFSTEEGVSIGAGRSEVIDIYGNPQEAQQTQGDVLFFPRSGYWLILHFRDDRVAEIRYLLNSSIPVLNRSLRPFLPIALLLLPPSTHTNSNLD
ncbi:hypothetical protein H6F67_14350 [Microcoleus sp. FACHB-1515]|uniref:hypothetical protein n=1 Tax=Cyanophyceae TaxID=3028117 RepID=UPI00168914F9|nr:hypothetical protein [Microcoleus sp. FACHB-1515]MBD2091033.1 hypothetical protein [Microcoleus sp. FACHB-1515]